MSEEKKEKSVKGGGTYNLASRVMVGGYDCTIDGRRFVIDYVKNYRGERQTEYASVCTLQETPKGNQFVPIQPQVFCLSDLTDIQLWNLAKAQVITLTKEQKKQFREKFYQAQLLDD